MYVASAFNISPFYRNNRKYMNQQLIGR